MSGGHNLHKHCPPMLRFISWPPFVYKYFCELLLALTRPRADLFSAALRPAGGLLRIHLPVCFIVTQMNSIKLTGSSLNNGN